MTNKKGYKSKKEKSIDLEKRVCYINLKFTMDQTLQEIGKNNVKKKKGT